MTTLSFVKKTERSLWSSSEGTRASPGLAGVSLAVRVLKRNGDHMLGDPPLRGRLHSSPRAVHGALLPSLPPHSSRSLTARVASWSVPGAESPTEAGWLRCAKGANGLPLPLRLSKDSAGAQRRLEQQASAAQQLTLQLTRLITANATAKDGVGGLCMIAAHAVGAEETCLVAASTLGMETCLSEHNFVRACEATCAASPVCQRLMGALGYELRDAAESRASLNIGSNTDSRSAALEIGQVALREPLSPHGAILKQSQPPLVSALVTPVCDPSSGSTVALLICCNARGGRFLLCDELLCECAALHAGLLWQHHIQVLRLVPLPIVPLQPPDASAERLREQWRSLAHGREQLRELRTEGVRALERIAGAASMLEPQEVVCQACRRLLRARAYELRSALRLASEQRASADALAQLAQHWREAVQLELHGEASRLGGAAAAVCIAEVLDEPLRAAAEHAANHFTHGPKWPQSNAELKTAPKTAVEALERLVIQPTLCLAAPTLSRLIAIVDERTMSVRARLAQSLVEQATWVAQQDASTADLLTGVPTSLGVWTDGWHAACLAEVRLHVRRITGDVPAAAAANALEHLVELHGEAMRADLSMQVQGASQLLRSLFEQHFWHIASWVDVELKGRLVYRERFLEKVRSDVPRWLRLLLAGIVQCSAAAPCRFEARAAAAAAGSAGTPLHLESPEYAWPTLSGLSDRVVGELLHAVESALEPLTKQYAEVAVHVRPRIKSLRDPVHEQMLRLLGACVSHARHVFFASRAMLRAADSVQRAILALEPQLVPLRNEKKDHAVAAEDVTLTTRQAIKQSMLVEMPQIVPALVALVAAFEHKGEVLEPRIQQLLASWTERSHVRLLAMLTDIVGPKAAEAALPRLADVLPASAQQLADELHRDVRMFHALDIASRHSLLEAESHVVRCMALPAADAHLRTATGLFIGRIGSAIHKEVQAILDKEALARGMLATASLEEVDAAASDAATEQHRNALYQKAAQVLAMPVVEMLEQLLMRALQQDDWQSPQRIAATAVVYSKSWLVAVRARVSRRFLKAASVSEHRLLEFLMVTLEQAVGWFGMPALDVSDLAIEADGLLTTVDDYITQLGGTLSESDCTPPAALQVLLLHHMEERTQPAESHDVMRGSVPSAIHAWALRRPAHVCLIDEVLAVIDAQPALTPEPDVVEELNALVIEDDSAALEPAGSVAAKTAATKPTPIAEEPSEPESSSRVLAHLADTLWRLNNEQLLLSQLVQVLAAAVPLCFDKDRPIELAFYCLMEAAPADHRLEGEREQLYYARLSGTRLEEQQTMFRVAAPLAVQIALADGSRVEESVLQLPLLTPGLERHGMGGKTIGTRHRLYLPLHSASAPKPISVMEVALLRGGELRRAERLILSRLASAFGAAVARDQHAAADTKNRRCSAQEAVELRLRAEELESSLAAMRQQAFLSAAVNREIPASGAALAASLRALTGAEMVTLFMAPDRFSEMTPQLIAEHNDFSALNRMMQPTTPARESSVLDALPHQGLARRAALQQRACNCIKPIAEPVSVFDATIENRVGYKTLCVLVLPIMQAGRAVGVLQLTNKAASSAKAMTGAPPMPGTTPAAPSSRAKAAPVTSRDLLFGAHEAHPPGAQADGNEDDSSTASTSSSTTMAFTEQDEQAARSQLAACALLIFQARRVVELEEHTKAAAAAARAEHKPNFRAVALGSPSERIPQPPPVNIPASRPPPLPRSHPQLSEAPTASAAAAGRAPAAGPPRAAQQELSNSSLLDAFFVITQELSGAHNLRVLLGSALRSCKRLVPVQSASCFLTGEDDGSMLRVALVQDEHGKDVAGELSVVRIRDVRSGLAGNSLATKQTTIVQDTAADANFDPSVDCAPGYMVRSVLSTPLVGSQGRLLGVLQLCNRITAVGTAKTMHPDPREFGNDDEIAAVVFARMLAAPLERLLAIEGFFNSQ